MFRINWVDCISVRLYLIAIGNLFDRSLVPCCRQYDIFYFRHCANVLARCLVLLFSYFHFIFCFIRVFPAICFRFFFCIFIDFFNVYCVRYLFQMFGFLTFVFLLPMLVPVFVSNCLAHVWLKIPRFDPVCCLLINEPMCI